MNTSERSILKTRQDSILESFASLSGGVILSRLVAFVGTAYLARVLGTYAFGIIGLATAVTTLLAVALRTGFEPVGAREVARDPKSAANLAAGVGIFRLLFALLGIGLLAFVTFVLDKPQEVRLVVFLTGFLLLPLALDARWVYRGLARNRWVGFSMVVAQIVYVGTLLLVVKGPKDVIRVPPALVLGEMAAVVFLALPLMSDWKGRTDWRRAWGVLRSSGFLVASGVLGHLTRTTDVVIIAFLLGENEVGIYSAAYRVCFLVMAIGLSLHSTYLPRLAQISRDDPRAMSQLANRAWEAGGSLAIPIVVGGWILAEPLLSHLFGPEYAAGQGAFRLLLLGTGFFFLHGILFHVMVAFDRTRPELTILGTAAGLNVVLNILLIPGLGIQGAALATVLAEGLVLGWRWVVCRRLGVTVGGSYLWKQLGAAMGMGAAILWMDSRVSWWGTILLGGVTYVILLGLLRGYPRDLIPQNLKN